MIRFSSISCFFMLFSMLISAWSLDVFAVEQKTDAVKTNTLLSEEEVYIWGEKLEDSNVSDSHPTSVLIQKDMVSINAVTTEDLVKYEPSVVIRRRFIGDANGTIGMRGSNMFQTSRSMVFADGVPLHYHLQSRWNGAPRWSLVSASEIAKVEVVYGPFSAEYSGNAMAGVVLIETGIPQKREFYADISTFSQEFDDYGFDDRVNGYKGFVSYGDKLGGLNYYVSYNRLDSDSQPQIFRGSGDPEASDAIPNVIGGISGLDDVARERVWYGDTGVVNTITDNYKLKLGYDFGQWQSLVNVAFEDRFTAVSGNSYVTDLNGNTLWSGNNVVSDGSENRTFSFNSGLIGNGERERESLSLGLRVKGQTTDNSTLEFNVNRFDIRKDVENESALNVADSDFDNSGQIIDYDNSGWQTASVKYRVSDFLVPGMNWLSGASFKNYELNVNVYDSPNYFAAEFGDVESRFGGKTSIKAGFTQFNWDITEKHDASLGLRYERFSSQDGYYSDNSSVENIIFAPATQSSKTSPKFSFGYNPKDDITIRYSLAKAYRFPIVEELFRQYQAFNSLSLSNPELKPENGTHHNIMFEKNVSDGYWRVNLFQDDVKDAIESQTQTILTEDGEVLVSTFSALEKTRARGVELVFNQENVLLDHLNLRFNLTYTDAKIRESRNDDWQGKAYPRMPKWRSHFLVNYQITRSWDVGGNLQYASDSFGDLNNGDTIDQVYGAQDAFTRIGLKTTYSFNKQLKASFGIDNLTNQIAYVVHPWPGRTVYLSLAYRL